MKATSTIQFENERAIVTEWHFAQDEETGYHVHARDYVVVPLSSGTLRLEQTADAKELRLEAGASYAGTAGTAHNVINANIYEIRFIEIELK